jgi:hypothetical protein
MIHFNKRLKFREMLSQYVKLEKCDWTRCLYCNNNSTGTDHVLPVSVLKELPFFPWPEKLLVLVPVCATCNSIAGARLFSSIDAKRRYIQLQLNKRVIKRYLEKLIE